MYSFWINDNGNWELRTVAAKTKAIAIKMICNLFYTDYRFVYDA